MPIFTVENDNVGDFMCRTALTRLALASRVVGSLVATTHRYT